MERTPALCLLMTLLGFYLLVPSSAVPLSRLQKTDQMPLVKGSIPEPKMKMEGIVPENDGSSERQRMTLETQDYGPPTPNNHHKPPGWR